MCTYNYMDSSPQRPVWTTGTLARTLARFICIWFTTCNYFNAVRYIFDVVGNTEGSTIYFEHEKGTDQD